ncbi:hypothetical protein KJ966_27430 [bacterium]|nr:hypothetical protein [bacterium]
MLEPVFPGLRRDSEEKKDGALYTMSSKEKMALKEAQRIVSNCSTRIENPFKYGEGTLEKNSEKS